MANAMVIGIGGVGSVIGQKLHEYDCFDKIILADLDPVFARQLAARTAKNRFVVVQANAMDTEGLAALMKEHKVAVTCNACVCQTNYSVLEACLRATDGVRSAVARLVDGRLVAIASRAPCKRIGRSPKSASR